MEEALAIWPTLKPEDQNELFLRGLMHGLPDRAYQTTLLERLAADPSLVALLIPLTAALPQLTEADFLRIRSAIERDQIPATLLRRLNPGIPLRTLPDAFLKTQFEEIARARPDTVPMLFQVLFLYCHGDTGKFAYFADTFRGFLLTPGLPILETHLGYEWHEVAMPMIISSTDEKWLAAFSRYVVTVLRENETSISTPYLRKVATALLQKAPDVAWPPLAEALIGDNDLLRFIVVDFLGGGGHGFDDHSENCPLWEVPLPQFQALVEKLPSVIPVFLNRMQLYRVTKDAAGAEEFYWHPHALMLMERAVDESDAFNGLFENLSSFGSTGSRVPYWERRLVLARKLDTTTVPRLRNIGRKLVNQIEDVIENTKRREMNEQARRH